MKKSKKMTKKEFNIFKNEVLRYQLQNEHFFYRNNKNVFFKQIINDFENRFRILQQLYDKINNKKKIYRKVTNRY